MRAVVRRASTADNGSRGDALAVLSRASFFAAGITGLMLSRTVLPCSAPGPSVLARDDARVAAKRYAGKQVRAFTMTLLDVGERGEYLSYLGGIGAGAYLVADACGREKCLDIYADRDGDGVLDGQYRISYGRGLVAKGLLFVRMFNIQSDVGAAMRVGGASAGLSALESALAEYRVHDADVSVAQSSYDDRLDAARRTLCPETVVSSGVSSSDDVGGK